MVEALLAAGAAPDAQGGADLGPGDGEAVVVLHVDVLEEGVGVLPESNGLPSNHVDGQ